MARAMARVIVATSALWALMAPSCTLGATMTAITRKTMPEIHTIARCTAWIVACPKIGSVACRTAATRMTTIVTPAPWTPASFSSVSRAVITSTRPDDVQPIPRSQATAARMRLPLGP